MKAEGKNVSTIVDINRQDIYFSFDQLPRSKLEGKLKAGEKPHFKDTLVLDEFEHVEHIKVPLSHESFQSPEDETIEWLKERLDRKV